MQDIAGSWKQEILVRPEFQRSRVWLELRGYARTVDIVDLQQGQGGAWTWEFSRLGLTATGTMMESGSPPGSRLQVHLDHAEYGPWSISNRNLPELVRLP